MGGGRGVSARVLVRCSAASGVCSALFDSGALFCTVSSDVGLLCVLLSSTRIKCALLSSGRDVLRASLSSAATNRLQFQS